MKNIFKQSYKATKLQSSSFSLIIVLLSVFSGSLLAQSSPFSTPAWVPKLSPSLFSEYPIEIGVTPGVPNAWINTYSNNCIIVQLGDNQPQAQLPYQTNHIRMRQRGDLESQTILIYDPNAAWGAGNIHYNCQLTTDYFLKTDIVGSKLILDGIDKNSVHNQYMSFWENNIKIHQNTVLDGNLTVTGNSDFQSTSIKNLTINQDLTVAGNSTLTSLWTANMFVTNNLSTTNLTVVNRPTFQNGIKIKNSSLQITDANDNIVWNFKEDGKLGIGVPSSEMTGPYWLWVKNGIMTERLKVAVKNTQDWKDYVFDKSYKLLSLSEVEDFINTNHHLPEIPSAEEVVRDGIDVQTMDAKLLQKIEELTLYVIDLKKEINKLKNKK